MRIFPVKPFFFWVSILVVMDIELKHIKLEKISERNMHVSILVVMDIELKRNNLIYKKYPNGEFQSLL